MNKPDFPAAWWGFVAALTTAVLATVSVAAGEDSAPAAAGSVPASTSAAAPATTTVLWSYQPVKSRAVPEVHEKKWVRTPIDAFVLAKLEASKLEPSADADRATFIRRATLDTWGLIPTPEDVKSFVNDRSSKAYEKLVDRLLASPHYGERWGRRWLDLARYADSDGYNADGTRPNMWRYRDYVIRAFNEDKPYDRFIKEQLAGDELWPNDQEALIATGFLRGYPDEINARDLNLKKQEIAVDLTNTTGSVFLATTVGCANCHNHKFDKISQKEYFQFQAFFINASARDDVPAATGAALTDYQQRLARYNEATREVREQMDALLKPVIEKLEADRLQGFVPQTRASIEKPESERNAYDRWIYHRNLWTLTGRTRYAEKELKTKNKDAYAKYQELKSQLKSFDALKPKDPGYVSTIFELGADAPPTNVLATGIYDRLLEEVQPGFPAALASGEQPHITPTGNSSGRRTALANWIASPGNPLTARVFVNRVWAQYFGHGIVDSVSDFGKMGDKPVNPELLDYLADTFVHQDHWSIKSLQRRLLLSSVYRQASAARPDAQAIDPTNRLLWAFPRQRLDAEEIRDSLLLASGLLEDELGGPAVFPPVPANFGVNAANPNAWPVSENPHDQNRRSVYVFVRRNTAYPLLDAFDMANPNSVHSRRDVTTTPSQALALINGDLVYQWSEALAARVLQEAGRDESARLERLYQILFGRSPDTFEKQTLEAFLDKQEKVTQEQLAQGKKVAAPEGYGVPVEVNAQVDKLYKALYGRSADRFERVALVEYMDKRQEKLAKAQSADEDAGDAAATATAGGGKAQKQSLNPARAAAFVDLVHAVANSNEFSYRF
jgi:Protein of unknown function (DUF1553)/Protein of unknown function (DUF1549)